MKICYSDIRLSNDIFGFSDFPIYNFTSVHVRLLCKNDAVFSTVLEGSFPTRGCGLVGRLVGSLHRRGELATQARIGTCRPVGTIWRWWARYLDEGPGLATQQGTRFSRVVLVFPGAPRSSKFRENSLQSTVLTQGLISHFT